MNRRQLLSILTSIGIGTPVFCRAVVSLSQDNELSAENLKEAAWITAMDLSDEDAESILNRVKRDAAGTRTLRKFELGADIPPAFEFRPMHNSSPVDNVQRNIEISVNEKIPNDEESVAFCSVPQLAHFLRSKQITSENLTRIYLNRLEKYGDMLRCVVNLTPELAMEQAKQADSEIAAGKIRGPLHGIPWGAKDLMDVPGYPTTWGIPDLESRIPETEATVYSRLSEAGAVLVAKLSLGALAMGDRWFGGKTRNPWNPRMGSSGSSAGSCSATVAGLVGFSLGSETLGSITTPSKICGANGFRPTFGRVSRHGCMPLSWTMDKIGPICRTVEGCAFVFAAIHGADGLDRTTETYAFDWPIQFKADEMTIGYQPGRNIEESAEFKILIELGFNMEPVQLPRGLPVHLLAKLIDVEAASVFDDMLRKQQTDGWNSWEAIFKSTQYISGIDYVRMMRLRTKAIEEFGKFMEQYDVLFNAFDVFHSNLSGHPSVVIPTGFTKLDGGGMNPKTVTFTGHLNDDSRLLWVANQFQQKSTGHLQHPNLDLWLEKFESGTLDEQPPREEDTPPSDEGK